MFSPPQLQETDIDRPATHVIDMSKFKLLMSPFWIPKKLNLGGGKK